ncbi:MULTISPECIES: flagellar basal body L-ring protein FlgH [unclassified Rhodosalinus]|uniref:flagellar basal body L-ring protein FlgH n=1 Tax=unclassified Rhodosalinus TaxID=2630183 RepID=UPI0035245972
MRCLAALLPCLLAACSTTPVGRAPDFSPAMQGAEHFAMLSPGLPDSVDRRGETAGASLWSDGRRSLLGDRRALERGDILTVVIEIDESAAISNSTERSRSGSESLQIPQLFGLPQRIDRSLPDGASMGNAIDLGSSSNAQGDGSVRRSEELTLRVAATVTDVLPSGVLAIRGSQEVRVNFELRELLVTGYVRPGDISRRNEITYDKIAAARISYGGRGQITDMQQPRYGQQALGAMLPF